LAAMMQMVVQCLFVFALAGIAALAQGQQNVTIPGFPPFQVVASDVVCIRLANNFVSQFATPPATCTTSLGTTSLWNKYRRGFNGVFFTQIQATTSKATCDAAANALEPATDKATALGMCTAVEGLTTACACDKLACVTDSVNSGVSLAESTAGCNAFAQKMCRSFQTPVNTACTTAVNAVVAANVPNTGVVFTAALVPRTCDQTQCRAAAASSALRIPTTGGGVYWAAAVVAWVVSML